MVGIVVAAHGRMAEALVSAAEGIVGRLENVAIVNLGPDEGLAVAKGKLLEAIGRVETGSGVVILADLFGGTPSNCCLGLLDAGRLEVVAGVNLPMLLKAATLRSAGQDVKSVAAELVEHGRSHIVHASDLLRARCAGSGR